MVAVACGSGITPVMSLIKTVLAREPQSRFVLLYGNRTGRDIIFAEALAGLKDRYLDRLSIAHVLSREMQDVPALQGRLDGSADRVAAARTAGDRPCLPVRSGGDDGRGGAAFAGLGLAPERIHREYFTPGEGSQRCRLRRAPQSRLPSPLRSRKSSSTAGITKSRCPKACR